MQHQQFSRKLLVFPAVLLVVSMTFCNMPFSGSQATQSPTINVTQAYQTVEAKLTQSISQTPPAELTSTSTQAAPSSTAPAQSPSPTAPAAATATQAPAQTCDRAAAGNPIDVSVPDDTVMQPGQSFTKIWRLENSGTCTWTKDYAVTYFSGEQMSAPATVSLRGDVSPGQSVDISVDMVAPLQAGTYQGNWKLRNASNVLFGIGPGGTAPFWVRIVVKGASTASATAGTPTTTATPSATAPAVLVSGRAVLNIGDKLDLDTLGVNSGSGEDFSYESNEEAKHLLIPLGDVISGRYGENQPTMALCQQANLSGSPITLEDLPRGSYLCYRTSQGLPGWARITDFNIDNYALTLDILTWSLP